MGADWDQFSQSGWEKAGELSAGKLQCDSSRSYLATNRSMAAQDDEWSGGRVASRARRSPVLKKCHRATSVQVSPDRQTVRPSNGLRSETVEGLFISGACTRTLPRWALG